MESVSSAAVAMRFFANWDTIRENNYTIPRSLSMVLTRLTFFKHMEVNNNIVIAVRLHVRFIVLEANFG
jgi:hypothetical protein